MFSTLERLIGGSFHKSSEIPKKCEKSTLKRRKVTTVTAVVTVVTVKCQW
jgi:hypothetical protein